MPAVPPYEGCSMLNSADYLGELLSLRASKTYSESATEMKHLSLRAINGTVKSYSNVQYKANIGF